MTAGVVLVAVVVLVGLCVVWDRTLTAIVTRQQNREAERLRRERWGEPPVLGGTPKDPRTRSRWR